MKGAGVSILKGSDWFELTDEVRISPAPKLCGSGNDCVRCLGVRRDHSVLTDIDQASKVIERRIDALPPMHRLWFHPSTFCLGYRKRARVGNPTELFFVDNRGALVERRSLPDAIGDVVPGPGAWYIGCRDGRVYAWAVDGTRLWTGSFPLERFESLMSPLLTPPAMPLHVGSGSGSLIGAAQGSRCYLLDAFGHKQGTIELPRHTEVHEAAIGSHEIPTRAAALARLGLPTTADAATGFLRLELKRRSNRSPEFFRSIENHQQPAGARLGDDEETRPATNRRGRVIWRAEFPKQVGGVVASATGLDVLAGPLFCFQRAIQDDCGEAFGLGGDQSDARRA